MILENCDASQRHRRIELLNVVHWNEQTDGPFTEAGLRANLESRGYRVTRYVYPPGTRFPEHTHEIDKIDAVVSGRFRVTVDGREALLEAGDAIEVPRGTRHSAEAVGSEPVMSLDATKD